MAAKGGRRGEEAPAVVALHLDRWECRPGDTVMARMDVTPAVDLPDPDDVECAVILEHVEHWGGSGSNRGARDWEVAGEYVLVGLPLRAGVAVSATVALPIPRRFTPPGGPEDLVDERYPRSDTVDDDAYDVWIDDDQRWGPPTSVGPGGSSTWQVRASLTGPGDVEVVEPLVVLAPPGPVPPAPPERRAGKDVRVSFSGLPTASVPAPGAVAGRLWLTADQDVTAREVRVELVRQVRAQGGDGAAPVLGEGTVATAVVSGALTLAARRPRELGFRLEVPDGAGPSVEADGFRVCWLVRAVIDRAWRVDDVWEQPVTVHGAEG